jgi:siroheme synthase (precorrin-2 oxidase/ferrochelatase)
MVSTNGNGPRMAAIVRRFISKKLPKNTGQAIIKVGQLRKKLRRIAPDIEEGPKRMKWYGLSFKILDCGKTNANIHQDVRRLRSMDA